MREGLEDLLGGLEPVSLEPLDQRAALLGRVDNKYCVFEVKLKRSDDKTDKRQMVGEARQLGAQPGNELFE